MKKIIAAAGAFDAEVTSRRLPFGPILKAVIP
jgi:hypothetical protein